MKPASQLLLASMRRTEALPRWGRVASERLSVAYSVPTSAPPPAAKSEGPLLTRPRSARAPMARGGVLARKEAMTSVIDEWGAVHAATVLRVDRNVVLARMAVNGRGRVVVGAGVKKHPTLPQAGQALAAGLQYTPQRFAEFDLDDAAAAEGSWEVVRCLGPLHFANRSPNSPEGMTRRLHIACRGHTVPFSAPEVSGWIGALNADISLSLSHLQGSEISPAMFTPGQFVDVRGRTVGKGFAGPMKRWNFRGLRASHGVSKAHRSHGSMGGCQDPGRVFPGKKMAGHMGNRQRLAENLRLLGVDLDEGVLLVKGAIPGGCGPNSWVRVSDAHKRPPPAAMQDALGDAAELYMPYEHSPFEQEMMALDMSQGGVVMMPKGTYDPLAYVDRNMVKAKK